MLRSPLPRRRFLTWLAAGACTPSLLSCAGQGGRRPGEIVFWTMQLQPKFIPYFTRLIQRFEAENPGQTVRWVDIPWSAMRSKILTAVSAGTAPDVVNLNPDFASQLAARGALLNLEPKVSTADRERFLPNLWQAGQLGNETFGLPWYLTTRVTIANRQLLTRAGFDAPPRTWDEVPAFAHRFRQRTGRYALFASFVPEDSAEVLESLVQMGVTLVNPDGRAGFDSEAGRRAFGFWVDLFRAGLLPQECLTQGHRRAIELYQAGDLGLLQSGPEFLNSIATNAPAIARVSEAFPQLRGENGATNVAAMNLVIPRDAANPDGALRFALTVTDSTNQLAFAEEANVLPSTREALTRYRAGLSRRGGSAALIRARALSAEQITSARVLVPAMRNLNVLQKLIYDNLQAAMLGRQSTAEAVTAAATAWNRRLSGS